MPSFSTVVERRSIPKNNQQEKCGYQQYDWEQMSHEQKMFKIFFHISLNTGWLKKIPINGKKSHYNNRGY